MKARSSISLAVMLLVAILAFATSPAQVFVTPSQATVFANGQSPSSVTLDALCNQTPCNFTWVQILSNSNVGGLDTTSGPVVHFVAGTVPGEAYIFVTETHSQTMKLAVVTIK
jgi:hypothetical protein